MKFFSAILIAFLSVLVFLLASCNGGNKENSSGGVAAKDALATFRVAEGFKIEMIASEPLISDPVDMEIDEYGRMYVVEMHGYPLDVAGSGKVILLSDKNGDGNMDQRTVFKEGLVLPTSIMRWKKGVLVTDAPNLLYLEDSDGDGIAEKTDTVLHGFALSNPQHNVNSPVYAMDNWIYIAHEGAVSTREYKEDFGDEGSDLIYHGKTNAPKLGKNGNGRSLRIRPDQLLIENTSSRCQFGHTFDEWGHHFECNNSNQGYHEVIANRYFERNKELLISNATHSMSDHLDAAEVYPITTHPDRQLLTDVGVMTSGCGLTAYLGNAFPEPYNSNVTFIAEPVSNLVHVDKLKDSGASFTASRILEKQEFLSSTDSWSRPVNMYIGPDGAMYVLDYYRQVIESPEWMSEDAIKAGGLYNGSDKGRIYRITAKDAKKAEWTKGLKLGEMSSSELVKYLGDPNIWWRINAQRLIVDRKDTTATASLNAMLNDGPTLGRLHALWTLEGLGQLNTEQIKKGLRDSVAGIRENAVQLAELHRTTSPSIEKDILLLQNDPDHKVRFQVLLTLGFFNSPAAAEARNRILFSDINDNWIQVAALSASSLQTAPLLKTVMQKYSTDNSAYALLLERLTTMIGSGGTAADVHGLLQQGLKDGNSSILEGLAEGLKRRKNKLIISSDDQHLVVNTFFAHPSSLVKNAAMELLKANSITDTALKMQSISKAVTLMNDQHKTDQERAYAVRFLMLGDPAPYVEDLKKLIVPKEEPVVQVAALHTLAQVKGTAVSEYVIERWPLLTPEVRDDAIGTFLMDSTRISLLIDAMEKEKIQTSSVSFGRSVQLMQNSNEQLRNRARTLFTKNERERKKINKDYQDALELDGDIAKGKEVFIKNCAICHQVRGKLGVAIGPDLGTVHNWIKEDIMANVLDPNLSISSGYDLWEAKLNNGETVQGIIASESASAITLRNNGKMDRTVNRQEIASLRSLNASAMPGGFEKTISHQQMADLLAFLRQH